MAILILPKKHWNTKTNKVKPSANVKIKDSVNEKIKNMSEYKSEMMPLIQQQGEITGNLAYMLEDENNHNLIR